MCTLSKYVKNESSIVSPAEIREIHPHLNTDKIIGGLYAPNDGSVDPTGECIYPWIYHTVFNGFGHYL